MRPAREASARACCAWLAAAALAAALLSRGPIDAQVRPVYDLGTAGLVQALQRLRTTASALHTGAHPDDEDSAFMARTARGDAARVAYLSLTRGEGGQNILGPELFDSLGVIRTEELLQARRLDGGRQFFTRAFDFGFSKTRAETATRWNEREILGDMVRVIRTFRPLVIYARYSGTAADGHGHHQMSGYLTPLAFEAAADPGQFPELAAEGLRPWRVRKLYRSGGGRQGGAGPTLEIETGVVHPAIGRSYAEIAAHGRSQHKSQEFGAIEPLGPASTTLRLVTTHVPAPPQERSIFDGLDVTLPGLGALAGLPPDALRAELAAIDRAGAQALAAYEPLAPAAIVPALADGLRAVRAARATLASVKGPADAVADAAFLLSLKEDEFVDVLARAAGIVVDPIASDEVVTRGGATEIALRAFVANPDLVRLTNASVRTPEGWTVTPLTGAAQTAAAGRRETPTFAARFRVTVPADAPLTQPYFLATPRDGDAYRWAPDAPKGRPFAESILAGAMTLDVAGITITIVEPVTHRLADPVRGELRRDVNVVPAVAVGLDTPLLIVPAGSASRAHRIVATARSFSDRAIDGVLRLRLPPGWIASPPTVSFSLARKGESVAAPFTVTAAARRAIGRYEIGVEASAAGVTFDRDVREVAYPHIQTHRLYPAAAASALVLDLQVAAVRVGYIMGSGDQVADAIRRVGVDVTMLDDEAIAFGDLSRFDTIVVGIRAAEARPAFVTHHARLRTFMEQGGTLIVQYQQSEYIAAGLPPYPAQMTGNSRVTDERAPVTMLAPGHPALSFPNRIGAQDFDGWVQERNLYAFTSFDARYQPLLESVDPGEAAQRGGELYAEVGKGRYVYTAFAWFRQLPAGVPGAYRLFANLISLPKAPARAGSPARGAAPRTGAAAPRAADRTRPSR